MGKWGELTLPIGVATPLITSRGPACTLFLNKASPSHQEIVDLERLQSYSCHDLEKIGIPADSMSRLFKVRPVLVRSRVSTPVNGLIYG